MDELRIYIIKSGIVRLTEEEAQLLHGFCARSQDSIEQISTDLPFQEGTAKKHARAIYRELRIGGRRDITPEICQLFYEVAGVTPGQEPDWANWPPPEPEPPILHADTTQHPDASGRFWEREFEPWQLILGALVALVGLASLLVLFFFLNNGDDDDGSEPTMPILSDITEPDGDQTAVVTEPATEAAQVQPTPVPIASDTPSPTNTSEPTTPSTSTSTPTNTPSPTDTPTVTPTSTETPTPTDTPPPTETLRPTETPTLTPIPTPSITLPFHDPFDGAQFGPEWDLVVGQPIFDSSGVRPLDDELVFSIGENLTDIVVEFDYGVTPVLDAFNEPPQVFVSLADKVRFAVDPEGASVWQTLDGNEWRTLAGGRQVPRNGHFRLVFSGGVYQAFLNAEEPVYSTAGFGGPVSGSLKVIITEGGRIDNFEIREP